MIEQRHLQPWVIAALFGAWWGWLAAFVAVQQLGLEAWLWSLAFPLVLTSAWVTATVARKRPLLVSAALMASPVVVMPVRDFVRASQSYLDGSARLIRVGLPSNIPPFRLDEDTRIPIRYSGCVTSDVWDARVWINNETVLWLSETLGPMPGLYTGPLPPDEEMAAAIDRNGVPLSTAYDGSQLGGSVSE